jgi:dolichol-phosphate mannosyltransferase
VAFIPFLPSAITATLTARLVVVVPVYNEAHNIRAMVEEWTRHLTACEPDHQILLIDDDSRDGTMKILREMEACDPARIVVVTKPNSGHGRTCRLGYSAAALAPSVDWVLQIDSDGQCDPRYFPEFWGARSDADCLFGRRETRDDGAARAVISQICRITSTVLTGVDLVDPNVPYRLMRRETLANAIAQIPASFDIHNVALTYVLKQTPGLRWRYFPIRFRNRQGGSNSINLWNIVHLGVSMLFDLANLRSRLRKGGGSLPLETEKK